VLLSSDCCSPDELHCWADCCPSAVDAAAVGRPATNKLAGLPALLLLLLLTVRASVARPEARKCVTALQADSKAHCTHTSCGHLLTSRAIG
jgi:hypothetical protein